MSDINGDSYANKQEEAVRVAVVKCKDYQKENLEKAVDTALDYIGGLKSLVTPGMKVLLKVNLLTAKPPEKAVTTHPALVGVLCKKIKELGATPWVGDSSGGMLPNQNPTAKALKVSEVEAEALKAGAEVFNFDRERAIKVENPGNKIFPYVYIASPIYEADLVISLPKLKTHGLTMFTGAIKNMFGAVPGSLKRDYHRKAPHVRDFGRMLADIYHLTSPALTIMDGVVGMEEDGPSSGSPKELQMILASRDGVALDEVAAEIIGYSPETLPTAKAAARMGYGVTDREKIEIPGELKDWKVKYFQPPKSAMVFANYLPGFVVSTLINQLKTLPVVEEEKCTGCGVCKKSCPVYAIEINKKKAKINYEECIECLCCHELCPESAVKLAPRGILSSGAFFFLNLKRKITGNQSKDSG